MTFHPHTAIPTTQRSSYEQREYPDNKPMITSTLRSLLSDIIEVIDTLESLKSKPPVDSNFYVPKFMTPAEVDEQTAQSEFAQKVAEALEKAQLGEVENVSGDGIIIHTYTPDTSCAHQDPEENAHQAAMFTPEEDYEASDIASTPADESLAPEPAAQPVEKKTRKPRTAKAPKPEPVDIAAVRQLIASAISQLVEAGGKDRIKTLLATYGVDRARELGDDKVENFLADISTL